MRAIAILGSRNPEGQTASAAKAVLGGLSEAGWKTAAFYLPEMSIERCRQCDERGWGICRSEGKCVIEDDFASLVKTLRSAEAVVLATPVYFGDLSESIRAFLDRLRRTCVQAGHRDGIAGKPAVGICVAGGGGGGAPYCCQSLERVVSSCGLELVDVVPIRRQNLEAKLPTLGQVGRYLATVPGGE